jgi:DNA-binding XRE family transcriptional regulator
MDFSHAAAFKAADPLRSYILVLREGRHMSQPDVAASAGIKRRTYIAWENGEVGKLDIEVARAIVRAVGGLFEHVDLVLDMTAEQAREMAHNWLSLSEAEREAARKGTEGLKRVVALADDDPYLLDSVLRRVRDAARADPGVLKLVAGYLAGLTANLDEREPPQ